MKNSSEIPYSKQILFAVIGIAGVLSVGNLIFRAVSAQQARRGFTAEEHRAAVQQSEARDRENWEKMWRDAGKKAPTLPALHGAPEHAVADPSVDRP